MTLWVLANDFVFADPQNGPTVLRAGRTIDDTLYPLAAMQTSGAIFVPSTPAALARAAFLAKRDARGQHGGLADEQGQYPDVLAYIEAVAASGLPALVVVRVNALGTGGAVATPYNANPGETVLVDASGGPVTINLPTLAVNQTCTVIQDASTSLATNAVTVNAPAGVTLEQPPPNNAAGFVSSFAFGGATAVFTGDRARGMSLEWFNGGVSGVYNLM